MSPTFAELQQELERVQFGLDRNYRNDPEHDAARLSAVERILNITLLKLSLNEKPEPSK